MAELGEFCSTIIFGLSMVDPAGLKAAGWQAGPWVPSDRDLGPGPNRFRGQARLKTLVNPEEFESIIVGADRVHRQIGRSLGPLFLAAAEAVGVNGPFGTRIGFLILHLSSDKSRATQASIVHLGKLARPGRRDCREMLALIQPPQGAGWKLLGEARGATISLSALPGGHDTPLTDWLGSTPAQRRLTDLLTLPAGQRTLSRAFIPLTTSPTPTTDLAVSGSSISVVRQTKGERGILRVEDMYEIRTFWTDAVLIELSQSSVAFALVERVRTYVSGRWPHWWSRFARRFRRWRSKSAWRAVVDHPMEAAIGWQLRAQLDTDALLNRVEREIKDHADASQTRATWVLAFVVFVLGIFPVIESIKNLIG